MPSLIQQKDLLRKEYDAERAAYLRDAETLGVDRRVKRGECWWPVAVGRSYYNSLDRFVVEIARRDDLETEHVFEYGRPVSFFSQDATGRLHHLGFTGIVSYAEADRMTITLPGEAALSQIMGLERPGVMLHFDETTYRLMFEALDRVIAAKGNRLAALRDMFHGGAPLGRPAAEAPKPSLPWLNAAQADAVADVLRARDVMIVHGPPGTGKTTTLAESVCEVLKRETQVLVCAQSNTAVDWISARLAERGLSVLRIGNPTRVTDEMLSFTYERRFEAHPDYPALWKIRRTVRQLYAAPRKSRGSDFHQKIARLREKADELEARIRHSLFDGSRVIAATLAGSAHPLMAGRHFHTLFIDEAAQALEAACWIALQKADRVVLAGDHCQLPPTVKCREAARGGLAVTLMEHLAGVHPEAVRLLTVQYRMNEALMRFSSDWFYNGRLTAAPEIKNRSLLDELDRPMTWIDTDEFRPAGKQTPNLDGGNKLDGGEEGGNAAGRSRVNRLEALITLAALKSYVQRIGRSRLLEERADFGVISPYRAQVQHLRGLIRSDDYLRPLRPQITVNTVDAFQGQERDVIVLSMVRANDEGQIGFLADLRRMNVAITRARTKLIVIGSKSTLCRHKFYKKLYESCEEAT